MHRLTALILISAAALAAASPALAQSGTTSRSDRNCTGSKLGTDRAAPCTDDVMRDPSGVLPRVVVAPASPTVPVVPVVPAVPAKGITLPGPVKAPAPVKGTAAR